MEKVFLLDIGGTNVRYALAEKGKTSIEKIFKKNIGSESLDIYFHMVKNGGPGRKNKRY